MTGQAGALGALQFSPDGKTPASSAGEGSVYLWDTKTGVMLRQFRCGTSGVLPVVFSPDGKSLAVASFNAVTV
jgi:WD40 repeat protein